MEPPCLGLIIDSSIIIAAERKNSGAATGELVGKITAEAAMRGEPLPFADVLIAACALERGYGVLTKNLRDFERVPGLVVKQI